MLIEPISIKDLPLKATQNAPPSSPPIILVEDDVHCQEESTDNSSSEGSVDRKKKTLRLRKRG